MKKFLKVVCKYLMIILGTALYATGTVFFVDPHDLAPGGATGVAIIIKILFGRVGIENVSVWLSQTISTASLRAATSLF